MAHAYVEQLSWRLPWFKDRVAAADGPPVDRSVESLDALAAFVAARAHDPGPGTDPANLRRRCTGPVDWHAPR